jgi:tripartite-type tricarboxylate transporter receptor subunit TctC
MMGLRVTVRKLGVVLALIAGCGTMVGAAAAQQAYPSRAITIVVPAAAGGPTDTVARLVGESMGRTLGQQIVIENVGGAGGTIGMARVAKSPADGYTLAVWHIGQATAPALYEGLRYNVIDDFDSIGRITDVPMTVVGKATLEPKDIAELLAWVKQKQAGVTYAHAGIGSASHLCALMFMSATGAQMTAVSYRGTGPAMNDLLGGQFDMMCDQTTGTTNQIKEGKIKGYAATTRGRLKVLPELPTLDESGLKGFEVSAWHAMWAPKGLPAEALEKLTAALQAALKDPKVIERFAGLGTEPVPMDQATPGALKSQLQAEVAKWGPVIKASGAKGN